VQNVPPKQTHRAAKKFESDTIGF